jgi:hypothetical protein
LEKIKKMKKENAELKAEIQKLKNLEQNASKKMHKKNKKKSKQESGPSLF